MADGGTCTVGDLTAGQFLDKDIRGTRYGCEAMLWLMAVVGVNHSSEIGGQYVRVAFDKDGHATCIGHIVKNIWLNFKMLATWKPVQEPRPKNYGIGIIPENGRPCISFAKKAACKCLWLPWRVDFLNIYRRIPVYVLVASVFPRIRLWLVFMNEFG